MPQQHTYKKRPLKRFLIALFLFLSACSGEFYCGPMKDGCQRCYEGRKDVGGFCVVEVYDKAKIYEKAKVSEQTLKTPHSDSGYEDRD